LLTVAIIIGLRHRKRADSKKRGEWHHRARSP
jgi:hypothetical protein